LRAVVRGAQVDARELAGRLGWAEFDGDAELAEKLALGSSVGKDGSGVTFVLKGLHDLGDAQQQVITDVLREAWSQLAAAAEVVTASGPPHGP
jgi:hypothetical protein